MKTSEMFQDAFMDGGTSCIDCGFCGRTHFTHKAEGVEKLREKLAAAPDKYVEQDCGSVGFGYLDGRQFVWMCPCDAGAKYEKFVWRNRTGIIEYLKKRSAANLGKAQHDADKVASLS